MGKPYSRRGFLGTALTATPSQLLFNFSHLDDEIAFWQAEVPPYPDFFLLYMQGPTSNGGPASNKAQAAPTARPKVPMRRRGADCPVVVPKRV